MALGTEVGLGPRHIVLHGDPAPSPKKGADDLGWLGSLKVNGNVTIL